MGKDEVDSAIVESFTCAICGCLCVRPVFETNCESAYCFDCLDLYWEQCYKDACPNEGCKEAVFREITKVERISLERLVISCRNEENGCRQILQYKDIEQHENSCEYVYVKCPGYKMCRTEMLKFEMKKHENQYQYAVVECSKCSQQASVEELSTHTCEDYIVQKLREEEAKTKFLLEGILEKQALTTKVLERELVESRKKYKASDVRIQLLEEKNDSLERQLNERKQEKSRFKDFLDKKLHKFRDNYMRSLTNLLKKQDSSINAIKDVILEDSSKQKNRKSKDNMKRLEERMGMQLKEVKKSSEQEVDELKNEIVKIKQILALSSLSFKDELIAIEE